MSGGEGGSHVEREMREGKWNGTGGETDREIGTGMGLDWK